MSLKIASVHGHGDAEKEYVLINVISDCDLEFYALADTTYLEPGRISDKLRHFYWFPKKQVKAGHYVALRTGNGRDRTLETENGYIIHELHWKLKSAVWNDTGDTAVLFSLDGWDSKLVT